MEDGYVERAAYDCTRDFFQTLCGQAESVGRVTGLQLEMQQRVVDHLKKAYDAGYLRRGEKEEKDRRIQSQSRQKEQQTQLQKLEETMKQQKDKYERMVKMMKDRIISMQDEFESQTHHFRLQMSSFGEQKAKFMKKLKQAENECELLERRCNDLDKELNLQMALKREKEAEINRLESEMQQSLSDKQSENRQLRSQDAKVRGEMEAQNLMLKNELESFKDAWQQQREEYERRAGEREETIVSLKRQMEEMRNNNKSGKAVSRGVQTKGAGGGSGGDEERLREEIRILSEEKKQLVIKLEELDELHANAHRELESRYVSKLASMMANHEEQLQKEREIAANSQRILNSVQQSMVKQTRGMLHKIADKQTASTLRQLAPSGPKGFQFSDFSAQYSALLGTENPAADVGGVGGHAAANSSTLVMGGTGSGNLGGFVNVNNGNSSNNNNGVHNMGGGNGGSVSLRASIPRLSTLPSPKHPNNNNNNSNNISNNSHNVQMSGSFSARNPMPPSLLSPDQRMKMGKNRPQSASNRKATLVRSNSGGFNAAANG